MPSPGTRVSVVIPTYNRAHTIGRALRSVLAQTYPAYEILVVDDASTDETTEVIASLGDERIRHLRQSRNAGPGAARNVGMRESRAEFIAFLDSDDEWFPPKLERQVECFARCSDRVGLVYTGAELLEGGPPAVFAPSARGNIHRLLLERNVLHGAPSSALMRREVVQTVGYFDEDFPAIEDYDYWVRVAAHYEVEVVSEPLARYHDVASIGRVSRSMERNLRAREMFYEKHRRELERYGLAHHFLAQSAVRHLRRSHWAPAQGRRLVRKAIATRPQALPLYGLLAKSYIPTSVFRALVRMSEMPRRS